MDHERIFSNEISVTQTYQELKLNNEFMFGKVMDDVGRCVEMIRRLTGNVIDTVEDLCVEKAIRITDDSKGVRYDVYIDNGQEAYDVEMENKESLSDDLPRRSRFYQGIIDLKDLEKGHDYIELKDSYVIFICTFDPFDMGEAYYEFSNLCHNDTNFELNDGRKIIFFNTKGNMSGLSEETRRFLRYIETGVAEDAYTGQLEEAVILARQNRKWRGEYMMYSAHIMDARRMGKKEGLEEGLKAMRSLVNEGEITAEMAAKKLNMTAEEFMKITDSL